MKYQVIDGHTGAQIGEADSLEMCWPMVAPRKTWTRVMNQGRCVSDWEAPDLPDEPPQLPRAAPGFSNLLDVFKP